MGIKIAGVMFILMLAMGGAFYWYYSDSQERIAILQQNNAKLETAVAMNEETIKAMERDIQRAAEEMKKVNEQFGAIREQNRELSNKLARHDLGVLASQKSGLVENIINRATGKVNRCFELLSGAKLTEEEINAKDGKSFNSECPWLWPGPVTP